MAQFSASAVFIAIVTASWFNTGRAPGRPRHTGQTLEFGGSPKCVEQEQKILDFVRSCRWTSRPITASYFVRATVATVMKEFPCCGFGRTGSLPRFIGVPPVDSHGQDGHATQPSRLLYTLPVQPPPAHEGQWQSTCSAGLF